MSEITNHRESGCLLPDLLPPEEPRIGVWGLRRKHYLQQFHEGIYTDLLLSGKLNAHLEEIDKSANDMFELLMKQYAEREGMTEELNAKDETEWIKIMSEIRERVGKTIRAELVYKI